MAGTALLRRLRPAARPIRAICESPVGTTRPGLVMLAIVAWSNSESAETTSSSVDAPFSDTTCLVCRFSDSHEFVSL